MLQPVLPGLSGTTAPPVPAPFRPDGLNAEAAESAQARFAAGPSGAGAGSRAGDRGEGDGTTLFGRYISPVFDYNFGAERLVMLFRDPETGETVEQFPPETVLKQYEAALRRMEREDNGERTELVYPGGFPLPAPGAPADEAGSGGSESATAQEFGGEALAGGGGGGRSAAPRFDLLV